MQITLPDEYLDKAIFLALNYAKENCNSYGGKCDYYHALWPLLRKIGLGKSLSGQSDFYLKSLSDFALKISKSDKNQARVLISGCVDHQALVHLFAVKELLSLKNLEIVVVDLCGSPLKLNEWYGSQHHFPIKTIRSDILDLENIGLFDCIFTSSFLGYFDLPARRNLFMKYADLLNQQGVFIFANRIRFEDPKKVIGFTKKQGEVFCEQLFTRSVALNIFQDVELNYIEHLGMEYSKNFYSYPFGGEEELDKHIASLPFKKIFINTKSAKKTTETSLKSELTGPTVSDGSNYLLGILERL